MGLSIPDAPGVDPTWHVDTCVAAPGTKRVALQQTEQSVADSVSLRHARITQGVTDAILQADDLKSLHALVSAALCRVRGSIVRAWVYRRQTLPGPCLLAPLEHDAQNALGPEPQAGEQETASQVVETCELALHSRTAQTRAVVMTLGPGSRGLRVVHIEPLLVDAQNPPDGAIAFAMGSDESDAGQFASLCEGLATRMARAWRVHERDAHTQRIQSFLNNAMEAAYAGTWHIDLRTGQTLTSPTTDLLFGEPVTNQDIFGLVNRLIHPDDRDYIRRTYYEAIRAGEPYYHEYRIIRSDGVERWLCSRGIPVYGTDGKPAYVSGIIADITARVEGRLKLEQLAQNLKEAIDVRDDFLARASHELKTPLTALQLLVENQHRRITRQGVQALDPDKLLSVATRSLAQTERLRRLIDDMMDVSRIHNKRLTLDLMQCDLSQLVTDTAHEYGGRFEVSGAQLRVRVQPNVTGHWDPGRLQQVITNLLNNTLRYAPAQDALIELDVDQDHAILSIEDKGPGVPEHMLNCLFDNFRSGDSAGSMGGLGLGLHICREIAHLHQGSLTYAPHEDGGARFVLAMPLMPSDALAEFVAPPEAL